MTPTQIAINDRIVREYAARIEARGYQGDAVRLVEALLIGAIADGYKPVEPAPALRGPSSTVAGREAARRIYQQTRNAKASHNEGERNA